MATFGGIGRTGIADVRTVDPSDPRNPPWEAVQACFEDLITQGHRFDCDRDVTEQAGPPSEERCHNVAKTGVDSGGLQETGGDDRMAGT